MRGVAGGAVLFLGYEAAVPHYPDPSECPSVGMNLCSEEEDYYLPAGEHVPHSEHDPNIPNAYRWIASGQVNSTTSTGSIARFQASGVGLFDQ